MRGNLETIVGAMFAGKTSELLKRILWAKHQNKKIIVIKPSIDNRYSNEKIITHNDLSHECFAMTHWEQALNNFSFEKDNVEVVIGDQADPKFWKNFFPKFYQRKKNYQFSTFFFASVTQAVKPAISRS